MAVVLAAVALSIGVALGLCELGLRAVASVFFPKMMVLDDELGWRHEIDVRKTFVNELGEKILVVQNAYGHRGAPPRAERAAGSKRILTLGDSFTEGVQVSESDLFTARIAAANPTLEVLNAGVGGYGTVQEYLYLAGPGLALEPDLVLVMFYENDLTDNALPYYPGFGPRPYVRIENGAARIVETLDPSAFEKFILPVPLRRVWNDHSMLYYFVNSRIYQPLRAQRMHALQLADLQAIDRETRFAILNHMIGKLDQLLSEHDTPWLLVVIPSHEDATEGRSAVGSSVSELCRARAIRCLPLLDRLHAEIAGGTQVYFANDIHWTRDGHRVTADEILTYLRREYATP